MNINKRIKDSQVMLVVVNNKISFYSPAGALREQTGNRMDFNEAVRTVMHTIDLDRHVALRQKATMATVGMGRTIDDWHINISVVKDYDTV